MKDEHILLDYCEPFTSLGILRVIGPRSGRSFLFKNGTFEVVVLDRGERAAESRRGIKLSRRFDFNIYVRRGKYYTFYKSAYTPESVREKITKYLENEAK